MSYAPVPQPQPQPPRPPVSRGKRWILVAVTAGAAGIAGSVLVAGFMPDGERERDPGQQPVAQPQVVTTTAGTAAAGLSADQRAYLVALAAIDPGLVVDEDRAISRAESTCQEIASGKSGDVLVANVVQRLSGGNATVNAEQARQAIELMKRLVCPAWSAEWASKHPSPKG